MITQRRITEIGTRDDFINSYVESKFQLSRFDCLLGISKSILICQKSRTKTKVFFHGKKMSSSVARGGEGNGGIAPPLA